MKLQQSSGSTVADMFDSKESLKREHRAFNCLTGITSDIIRKRVPQMSSSKLLTTKVLPDDIFCLIGIPVVGKFGAFYEGFDKRTWAKLTLKIFKPRIFVNGGSCREKQILNLTKKPYAIPRMIAAFRFEFQNCLVLEYMIAFSLQDKLRFCRRFPPNVVLFFMCDMVMVISFLHSKGLIHRNITLDVFWIQENGHLKLVDYTRCIQHNAWFRKNSKYWNNLDYAPPEMFGVGRCTKGVDMWALGVILFKMTSGRQPFYADTEQRLIRTIKEKYPDYNCLFSDATADLCSQLLQKDPKHRVGYKGDTFLCISSYPYFRNVDWELVLSGASKAPEIPLLVSARRQAKYKVRPLDFRASANRPTILKKKPLLLREISTKSVSEMFNENVLDSKHAINIAKYQNKKNVIYLPRRKQAYKFSFQKIPKQSSLLDTPDERSPFASTGIMTSLASTSSATPVSANQRRSPEYLLRFTHHRLTLEQVFTDVLNEFEEKSQQDMPAVEALEKLRDTLNNRIDDLIAATIHRQIPIDDTACKDGDNDNISSH